MDTLVVAYTYLQRCAIWLRSREVNGLSLPGPTPAPNSSGSNDSTLDANSGNGNIITGGGGGGVDAAAAVGDSSIAAPGGLLYVPSIAANIALSLVILASVKSVHSYLLARATASRARAVLLAEMRGALERWEDACLAEVVECLVLERAPADTAELRSHVVALTGGCEEAADAVLYMWRHIFSSSDSSLAALADEKSDANHQHQQQQQSEPERRNDDDGNDDDGNDTNNDDSDNVAFHGMMPTIAYASDLPLYDLIRSCSSGHMLLFLAEDLRVLRRLECVVKYVIFRRMAAMEEACLHANLWRRAVLMPQVHQHHHQQPQQQQQRGTRHRGGWFLFKARTAAGLLQLRSAVCVEPRGATTDKDPTTTIGKDDGSGGGGGGGVVWGGMPAGPPLRKGMRLFRAWKVYGRPSWLVPYCDNSNAANDSVRDGTTPLPPVPAAVVAAQLRHYLCLPHSYYPLEALHLHTPDWFRELEMENKEFPGGRWVAEGPARICALSQRVLRCVKEATTKTSTLSTLSTLSTTPLTGSASVAVVVEKAFALFRSTNEECLTTHEARTRLAHLAVDILFSAYAAPLTEQFTTAWEAFREERLEEKLYRGLVALSGRGIDELLFDCGARELTRARPISHFGLRGHFRTPERDHRLTLCLCVWSAVTAARAGSQLFVCTDRWFAASHAVTMAIAKQSATIITGGGGGGGGDVGSAESGVSSSSSSSSSSSRVAPILHALTTAALRSAFGFLLYRLLERLAKAIEEPIKVMLEAELSAEIQSVLVNVDDAFLQRALETPSTAAGGGGGGNPMQDRRNGADGGYRTSQARVCSGATAPSTDALQLIDDKVERYCVVPLQGIVTVARGECAAFLAAVAVRFCFHTLFDTSELSRVVGLADSWRLRSAVTRYTEHAMPAVAPAGLGLVLDLIAEEEEGRQQQPRGKDGANDSNTKASTDNSAGLGYPFLSLIACSSVWNHETLAPPTTVSLSPPPPATATTTTTATTSTTTTAGNSGSSDAGGGGGVVGALSSSSSSCGGDSVVVDIDVAARATGWPLRRRQGVQSLYRRVCRYPYPEALRRHHDDDGMAAASATTSSSATVPRHRRSQCNGPATTTPSTVRSSAARQRRAAEVTAAMLEDARCILRYEVDPACRREAAAAAAVVAASEMETETQRQSDPTVEIPTTTTTTTATTDADADTADGSSSDRSGPQLSNSPHPSPNHSHHHHHASLAPAEVAITQGASYRRYLPARLALYDLNNSFMFVARQLGLELVFAHRLLTTQQQGIMAAGVDGNTNINTDNSGSRGDGGEDSGGGRWHAVAVFFESLLGAAGIDKLSRVFESGSDPLDSLVSTVHDVVEALAIVAAVCSAVTISPLKPTTTTTTITSEEKDGVAVAGRYLVRWVLRPRPAWVVMNMYYHVGLVTELRQALFPFVDGHQHSYSRRIPSEAFVVAPQTIADGAAYANCAAVVGRRRLWRQHLEATHYENNSNCKSDATSSGGDGHGYRDYAPAAAAAVAAPSMRYDSAHRIAGGLRLRESIALHRVCFSYPQLHHHRCHDTAGNINNSNGGARSCRHRRVKPTLREVSVTFPATAMSAVVGRTGSGKSSMTRLLKRGYDPLPLVAVEWHHQQQQHHHRRDNGTESTAPPAAAAAVAEEWTDALLGRILFLQWIENPLPMPPSPSLSSPSLSPSPLLCVDINNSTSNKKDNSSVGSDSAITTTTANITNGNSGIPRAWLPAAGYLAWDGVPLSCFSTSYARRWLAHLEQSPAILRNITFHENIRFVAAGVTSDEVSAAAAMCQCDEFISARRKGLRATTGTLSGGEKQRLALARVVAAAFARVRLEDRDACFDESEAAAAAAYSRQQQQSLRRVDGDNHTNVNGDSSLDCAATSRDVDVDGFVGAQGGLLLDEPTSRLDAHNELKVQETINNLLPGRHHRTLNNIINVKKNAAVAEGHATVAESSSSPSPPSSGGGAAFKAIPQQHHSSSSSPSPQPPALMVIAIAHRMATLRAAAYMVVLEDGQVACQGPAAAVRAESYFVQRQLELQALDGGGGGEEKRGEGNGTAPTLANIEE